MLHLELYSELVVLVVQIRQALIIWVAFITHLIVSSNNSYSNFVNIESALGNANGEALMGQAKFYPAVGDSTQNIGQLHSNIGHQRYDDTTRGSFRIGIIEAPGTENTGIRFFMSSGDIASGSIYIFGVKK